MPYVKCLAQEPLKVKRSSGFLLYFQVFALNALKNRAHQAHTVKYSRLCGGNRPVWDGNNRLEKRGVIRVRIENSN